MFHLPRLTPRSLPRQPAQVIVLFALASIPIMAAVGLAVDGGNILAQRRAAQNGADAAALSGVRSIARSQTSSIASDMLNYARQNAGTTATLATTYTDNAGTSVSLTSATGVAATVTKAFATYFLPVIGFNSYTVSATATARVQRLVGFTSGAPFIVCADGLTTSETWFSGGILDFSNTPPSIRSQALYANGGPEFYVHGSKVGQNDGDCGWENGSNFKGNTPPDVYSGCSTLPCWFPYDNGNKAGPTRVRVAGMDGCSAADDSGLAANCVAILPISVRKDTVNDACTGSDPNSYMCIVAWGAFELRLGGAAGDPNGCNSSNCHVGRLLGQVLVTEGQGTDWTVGQLGPLLVRLTQ